MNERELLHEMLEFLATEVDELGLHREMEHIERIIKEGTGADRQLAVWEETHDLKAVVDHIVAETYQGLDLARTKAKVGQLVTAPKLPRREEKPVATVEFPRNSDRFHDATSRA